MDAPTSELHQLVATTRRVAQRLLTIGENRIVLLTVELQEERERLLHVVLAALGMVVVILLGGMTLTALAAILLWSYGPVPVLLGITAVYGLAAACLWWRVSAQLRGWQTLPASLDQLRKDRATLDDILA